MDRPEGAPRRGRKPGQTDGGGRVKGTPNRPTALLRDKAAELGIDPFEVALLFAGNRYRELGYRTNVISPDLRARCALEACGFMYPKLKSVEMTADSGEAMQARLALVGDLMTKFETVTRQGKVA